MIEDGINLRKIRDKIFNVILLLKEFKNKEYSTPNGVRCSVV